MYCCLQISAEPPLLWETIRLPCSQPSPSLNSAYLANCPPLALTVYRAGLLSVSWVTVSVSPIMFAKSSAQSGIWCGLGLGKLWPLLSISPTACQAIWGQKLWLLCSFTVAPRPGTAAGTKGGRTKDSGQDSGLGGDFIQSRHEHPKFSPLVRSLLGKCPWAGSGDGSVTRPCCQTTAGDANLTNEFSVRLGNGGSRQQRPRQLWEAAGTPS